MILYFLSYNLLWCMSFTKERHFLHIGWVFIVQPYTVLMHPVRAVLTSCLWVGVTTSQPVRNLLTITTYSTHCCLVVFLHQRWADRWLWTRRIFSPYWAWRHCTSISHSSFFAWLHCLLTLTF